MAKKALANWRECNSLVALLAQINLRFPGRSKGSDGTIGDESHMARTSDHNAWIVDGNRRVVTALDVTNDPSVGCDSEAIAQTLIANRDPRIKYVISNKKICAGAGGTQPWVWRKYTGTNPHNHHFHISVKSDKKFYDDDAAWDLSGLSEKPVNENYVPPPPTLMKGSSGEAVKVLQSKLGMVGADVDGEFGKKTKEAVIAFQKKKGLKPADGIVGPMTWAKL